MQIFTDKDFPDADVKPQILQIVSKGQSYNMHPMHISMDFTPVETLAKYAEHSHDVYHIVLFGSAGSFYFKGRLTAAEAGTLVLCSPGEPHSFHPLHKGELMQSEFTFTYNSRNQQNLTIPFRGLLSLYFGFTFHNWSSVISLDEVQHTELHDILNSLSSLKESEFNLRFFRFHKSVSDLFTLLAFAQAQKNAETDNSIPSRLFKARNYMQANYHNKINLDKLALIACVSKRHFQRVFKLEYGCSPVTYMNRYKMSAAKNLLNTTSMSCTEIALELGFDDIFYFSKLFKKITGSNPKSQRERRPS